MEYLSIDRVEGEYAVCETDARTICRILVKEIAGSPKEGDVICRTEAGWQVDSAETARRRAEILRLQQQLFED